MWLYHCFSRISYVPLWHNHFQRLFRLNHCDPCLPPMLTERLWGRNSDFRIVFDFLYVWMYDVFRFLDFSFRSHWFLQHLHQLIKWTWTDHISWPWNSSADSLGSCRSCWDPSRGSRNDSSQCMMTWSGGFLKMGVPKMNGLWWKIRLWMDDLRVTPFWETSMY